MFCAGPADGDDPETLEEDLLAVLRVCIPCCSFTFEQADYIRNID